jgi:hypothetical protein
MLKKTDKLMACFAFLLIMATVVVTLSCDSMEEDAIPSIPNVTVDDDQIFVLSNGSGYIDLYSLISTNGEVNLNISSQPQKGELTEVGSGLLKYKPSSTFKKGRDLFTFSVFTKTNQLILMDSVIIIVGDSTQIPCGIYPNDDSVYVEGTQVDIDVLANDFICGDSTDIILEVYQPGSNFPPHFGTAIVTAGNLIRYNAHHLNVIDTVVYKVSRASDHSILGYGTVHINSSECLPSLPHLTVTDSSAYPMIDTVLIGVQPPSPICGKIYNHGAALVTQPKEGSAIVVGNWIWYVYELTDSKRMIRDSLAYRICADGGGCLNGTVAVRVN